MTSVGPILLALILCTVCTGTPHLSSAPPPPPDLISVCPAFNSSICIYARPGPPQCHNDSQCLDSKKCCCYNCGLMCVTPDKVRAGRCPDIKAKCHPEPTYNCSSDSDCPGAKKCCKICGRTCWDPAPEPVGVCPRKDGDQSGSLQCYSAHCSRDSDCKMGEKCCASEEGKSCVKPITVRPGKCPSPGKIQCIRATFTCKSDNDCSGEKKCCNVCGMNCWNPEPAVKAGQCPDIKAKCPPEPTYNCSSDSDCPGTKKCCNICGRTCWDPQSVRPGKCPQPFTILCKRDTFTCISDNDCSGDMKCCNVCGMNCWKPEAEPVGNCTKNDGDQSDSLRDDSVRCSRDSDCKMGQICRILRGGNKCVKST